VFVLKYYNLISKLQEQQKYDFAFLPLTIFELLDHVPRLAMPLPEMKWQAAGAAASG